MKRGTRTTWTKRVEEWRSSGKSAAAFAAAEGINALSLKWWKWRLGAEARAGVAPRPKRRRARPSAALARASTPAPTVSPMTFIEMTALVTEPLEVVLPSQVRIHVRTGFDAPTLSRVLDVLERRS